MKEKTILSFVDTLKKIKESNKSIAAYCKENNISKQSIYDKMYEFKRTTDYSNNTYNEVVDLYNSITSDDKIEETTEEIVDSENFTEVKYERDDNGKILYYDYKIYRKNKNPLVGKLTRDEMNIIYRLYSYYGASLTQREISRYFNELSLVDFKRILSAFNIYKASAPFAPHVIEETSTDDLRLMQLREKENDFLKKVEEDRIKNNEKLLKKYAQENIDLKKSLSNCSNIKITIDNQPTYKIETKVEPSNKSMILHLSDMHIGAKVESGSLYANNWNEVELKRRLSSLLNEVSKFGHLDYLIINLMGDNLDGMDNQTARRDHFMPQNMDNMEQVNTFINTMIWFVSSIKENNLCNKMKIYSVREGNHDGIMCYTSSLAVLACINKLFPDIETTQFEEFYGYYEFNNHQFLVSHGKDSKFMKRGLPLNLDDKHKIQLYEYLDSRGITGTGIHIVKGDLHTENINSCMKLDYRNVLSLFGASDYSNYNFSRSDYGVSYEFFIGETLTRGTFKNL